MNIDPPGKPGNDSDGVLVSGDSSEPSQRPWGLMRCTLSILAGLVGSAAMLSIGWRAAVVALVGDFSVFSRPAGFLPKILVFTVFFVGVVAPLAGGIRSNATSHLRWLVGGCVTGLIALATLIFLARPDYVGFG